MAIDLHKLKYLC